MYQAVTRAELANHTSPRKGVVAVRDVVIWCEKARVYDLGIYNRRKVRGSLSSWSLHAVGRAWDIGFRPGFSPVEQNNLAGRLALAAQFVGIAEVIYNRRRWTEDKGWQVYRGTDPHTTHIHVGFTVDWADNPSSLDDLKKWAAHFLYQGAM
jgi:hypothetical protein